MKRKLFLTVVALFITVTAIFAQQTSSLILTADSLATGNYKDVFSSFFQLAVSTLR